MSRAAAAPLDEDGSAAVSGISTGRWLTRADDLVGTPGSGADQPDAALRLCFPRQWPGAFKSSAPLQALLKALKGTRVRAVEADAPAAAAAAAAGVPLHALHSFSNAERLETALGWRVVKGFVVYECADKAASTQFVAVRHWWNQRADGAWVDLTSVAATEEERSLLVESKLGEKEEALLDDEGCERATALGRRLRNLPREHAATAAPEPTPRPPQSAKPVIDWGDAEVTTAKSREAPESERAVVLSRTARFAPWMAQLRAQLLEVAYEVVKSTLQQQVDELPDSEEEEDRIKRWNSMPPAEQHSQMMQGMQFVGHRLTKMVELIMQDLLPQMPMDPEALFLASAVQFIGRQYDTALTTLQRSLLASEGTPPKELAARYYYQANLCFKLLQGHEQLTPTGMKKPPPLSSKRAAELTALASTGIKEALRLDPSFKSAYIDAEMVAKFTFPDDPHALVKMHREMVEEACLTRRFWVTGWQRPMHFMRKLRSQPWWDATEFPWVVKMLQAFPDIKREVLAMRAPPAKDAKAERWDEVGTKHDAGDRELVEGGKWSELVLLNADPAVEHLVARNRRKCPNTLKLLDSIPEAAEMAKRGIGESTFSALSPKAHLKPHCGSTNLRLTCHLPLIAPEGCSIRVGQERRTYREGEIMIFDDSFEHEVWHEGSDGDRVVLLVRFWHPDIAAKEYAQAVHHSKESYFLHKRNLVVPPLQPSK